MVISKEMYNKIMGNYIYELLNKNNEIIYIGKTKNINKRLKGHIQDKKWFDEIDKILYTDCISKTDMDIYEIYYINKYNPCYNTQSAYGCMFSQKLKELEFVEFEPNFNYKEKVETMTIKMSNGLTYYQLN
jgi:hypothetical protein